jgi:hypothetical protein
MAVLGCSPDRDGASDSTSPQATCRTTGPPIDLGSVYPDQPPTTFRFTGSQTLFTASGFLHDAPLDPKVGLVRVQLGPADRPPVYNPQRGSLSNVTFTLNVVEDEATLTTLPAGDYWVVTGGLPVAIQPCGQGRVSDVRLSNN